MRGYADQLAAAGKPIDDDELIMNILSGFGLEYDAVVVNIQNRVASMNLQEVQYALQAHEIRLNSYNQFQAPCAHYTHLKGSRGGSFSARGRGSPSFSSKSKVVLCQLCGKTGYIALKCFKRFDINFTGPTSFSSVQANLTDCYHCLNDLNCDGDEVLPQAYDASWYVDSGATHHITNDLQNMTISSPYAGNNNVAVGSGHQLPISSIGQEHQPNTDERAANKGIVPA